MPPRLTEHSRVGRRNSSTKLFRRPKMRSRVQRTQPTSEIESCRRPAKRLKEPTQLSRNLLLIKLADETESDTRPSYRLLRSNRIFSPRRSPLQGQESVFTTRRILFIDWFVTLVLIITKIRVVTSLFTSSLNRSAIREKTRLGGRVANANERDKSHDKSNDRSKSSSQKIYKEKQFNKRINTLTHELSKSCYSRAVPGRPARGPYQVRENLHSIARINVETIT